MDNNSSPNLELVKTALDKILDESMLKETTVGKASALDTVVFTQGTADKAAVITTVLGGGGYFDKTTDDLSLNKDANIAAPTPKTTLIAQFKKDLPVSRTFMADQQHDAVSRAVKMQAKTWAASRDRNAALVYANGFSTQTTINGVALFSNSHVNQNGDTVDNLETAALSDTALNTVVNSLRTQVDQAGVIVSWEPEFLFVPSILHKTAMETAKSELRAGTGNNDLNYYSNLYPGMKVVYSPFLDAVSTTAYFVGSSGHGVMRWEREALFTELVDWKTSKNDQYTYKMRAREEVDSIDYVGLVGNSGTT